VAPGERLALAAFRRLPAIRQRAQRILEPNRRRIAAFLSDEPRLTAIEPAGGTVVFPRLPRGLDGDAVADHLWSHHRTLVVPGRFFEAPDHVRLSFGLDPAALERGLRALTKTLDALA